MRRISVLLGEMPLMLLEILRGNLQQQPEITVSCLEPGDAALGEAAAQADVLIFGSDAAELPARYIELLFTFPRLRALMVNRSGRTITLYELQPKRTLLGNTSTEELSRLIKDVVMKDDRS